MPLDDGDVIILDSSPKDHRTVQIGNETDVIELISDDQDELPYIQIASQPSVEISDEPLPDRIRRILENCSKPTSASSRDSIGSATGSRDSFFESFYQRWIVKERDEEEDELSQSVTEAVMIEDRPSAPVAKKARRTPATSRPPKPTAPKTKDEACLEVTLCIDDRLNRRLEAVPQMSTTFIISIERLEDQDEVRWSRAFNGTAMQCPVMALVLDCETFGPQIEAGPELFIASIKGRITKPQRYSQIYLVITGFKAFGSKLATRINKSFREAVLAGERIPSATRANMAAAQASWQEIEQRLWIATTSILVEDSQCPFRLVFHETAQLARQFLFDMTREIAWLPYNTNSLAGRFNFCTVGMSTTNGVKRNGDGPDETFRMMLCQVQRVTPQLALSITRVYPTFQALMNAYSGVAPKDAALLLQNVSSGAGRGIGQVLSTRIYKVFTGRDPDQLVK